MDQKDQSVVVISHAPDLDYTTDYVSLPREYGTSAYESRRDVQVIRSVVRENLHKLDDLIHFTDRLRARKVIIKPNLVTVFHNLGMLGQDYPESTDPRVVDAVVEFLQEYTQNIVIVESSGKGIPTRLAFHISGMDRLAKFRGLELIALEEQPTDRYLMPRARLMKEIVIPRIFSEVVRGETFYISIPKMKTNLYTGVTLGFKNAMGCLPYNLRQRNHNHAIDQKLVDMLHLFRADLVIIDGIVGGQGNCPAPVEIAQSKMIISGNHSVETDRVATRMMGINPSDISLMRIADENGFNDPQVQIIGDEKVVPFRPADPSLVGDWMKVNFPNVKVLIGRRMNNVPTPWEEGHSNQQELCAAEGICRGGCLAATRYAFDMFYYEGQKKNFHLTLLLGAGVEHHGNVLYYDASGRPYTLPEIARWKGKKLAIGTCARPLVDIVDRHIDGCMPYPNSPHMVIHQMSGSFCSVISPRNHYLIPGLLATLSVCERRKALLRKTGQRLDIPLHHEDKCYETRPFSQSELQQAYILEPFDELTPDEIEKLCKAENRSILATFLP